MLLGSSSQSSEEEEAEDTETLQSIKEASDTVLAKLQDFVC